MFVRGDYVRKVVGDYDFEGYVLSSFEKMTSSRRLVVVENRQKIVHVFGESNLEKGTPPPDWRVGPVWGPERSISAYEDLEARHWD